MARSDPRNQIRASVLDRIIEGGRGERAGPGGDLAIGIEDLKRSVRRDLEALLNSRRIEDPGVEERPEASRSLLAFGLPDLTSASAKNPADVLRISRQIEGLIAVFEPRLTRVKVEMVPASDPSDFAIRFRILGALKVEPVPEPVAFDAGMDPLIGKIQVN